MANFHITDDGPKPCKATKRPCPVGGEHFASKEEAQKSYEHTQEDALKSLKKEKDPAIDRKELKQINDFKADQKNFNKVYILLGDDSHVVDGDLNELEERYPGAFLETTKELGEFNTLAPKDKVRYLENLHYNLINDEFDEMNANYSNFTLEDNENYSPNVTESTNPLKNKKEIDSEELSKNVKELLAADDSYYSNLNGTIQEFAEDNREAFESFNRRYFTYRDEDEVLDKEFYTSGLQKEKYNHVVNEAFKDFDLD